MQFLPFVMKLFLCLPTSGTYFLIRNQSEQHANRNPSEKKMGSVYGSRVKIYC